MATVNSPGLLAIADGEPGRVPFGALATVDLLYVPRRGHTVSAYDVVASAAGTLQLLWRDSFGNLHSLGAPVALTASGALFYGSAQINRPIIGPIVVRFVSTAGLGLVWAAATDDLK
jgi:hypothetical protein